MISVQKNQTKFIIQFLFITLIFFPNQSHARFRLFGPNTDESKPAAAPPATATKKAPQASDKATQQPVSPAQQKQDLINKYKKTSSASAANSNKSSNSRSAPEAELPFSTDSGIPLPDFSQVDGVPGTGTEIGNIAADILAGRMTHEITNNITYKAMSSSGGFKLSDIIGSTTNLSPMQGTLLNAGIAYIAEHPSLGGNPNRGYRMEILPALARAIMSNRLIMTRVGVFTYPSDKRLEYIFTGNSNFGNADSKVLYKEAYIAVRTTEDLGNVLVGPDLMPIGGEDAVMDLEGNTVLRSDNIKAMMHNSKGFEAFQNQGGVSLGHPTELRTNEDVVDYAEDKAAENEAVDTLNETTRLSSCFGFAMKLQFKKARDCFQKHRDEAKFKRLANYEVFGEMASQFEGGEDYETLKDFTTAAARGAAAGGVASALTGATDFGTGVGLGIVVNTMKTAYNKWFRKEVVTNKQINALMSFAKTYTYAPDEFGIINPGKDIFWAVYKNGVILRYKRDLVDTARQQYREYPVDALGNEIKVSAPFRITATKEMNILGLINGPEVMRKKIGLDRVKSSENSDNRNTGGTNETRNTKPFAPLVDDSVKKIPERTTPQPTPPLQKTRFKNDVDYSKAFGLDSPPVPVKPASETK